MPAPITAGLMLVMESSALKINPWDGEVPRYDANGNPINPDSTVTDPTDWPIVICKLGGDVNREWTFEDPYKDRGPVVIEVWGTTKAEVQTQLNSIEAFWASMSQWNNTGIADGPTTNPFYVVQMLLTSWTLRQEEGLRLAHSQLAFCGKLVYDCVIHGAIATS